MRPGRDNPYGILIVAVPFLVSGIILLLKTAPGVVPAYSTWRAPDFHLETASVSMEHAAGIFALIIGAVIIWFYFKLRKS